MNASKQQAGFTLIEVLIAVLVLSVGILGIGFLQTLGIRLTQNSFMLSVATQQAQDMALEIQS